MGEESEEELDSIKPPEVEKDTLVAKGMEPRSMRTLFGSHPFLVALGGFILALLWGAGSAMIIPSNPHNGFLLLILGIFICAPIFGWAYLLWKEQGKGQGDNKQGKRWVRWILLAVDLIAIAIIMILIDYGVAPNKINLTIPFQQVSMSDNQTKHAVDIKFSLTVMNSGNIPAYKIHSQELDVDGDLLEVRALKEIHGYGQTNTVNPIYPQEKVEWAFTIPLKYRDDNGTRTYEARRLFLYCKMTYSDAPNDGNSYLVEYWYSYNTDSPTIVTMLTAEQQSLLKPIVDRYFAQRR